MTGAGGAGGSHGRRHRAAASSGTGRSADHDRGRPDGGGRKAGDGLGRTETGAEGADVGAARVEGGASSRAGDLDRPDGSGSGGATNGADHPVRDFFRANPQVFVLLVICLVLGLGTFIVVLLGLVTAGSDQTTGEPSGAILGTHGAALHLQALFG